MGEVGSWTASGNVFPSYVILVLSPDTVWKKHLYLRHLCTYGKKNPYVDIWITVLNLY